MACGLSESDIYPTYYASHKRSNGMSGERSDPEIKQPGPFSTIEAPLSYQPDLLHSTGSINTYHVSMAITSAPLSSGYIQDIRDDAELLFALKELKNSIIGNTWKKVEVADSNGLLRFLLARTCVEDNEKIQLDIAGEIAVIIGAVASEGSLTIRQLLEARAAEELLGLVRRLADKSSVNNTNLVVSALRALRSVLVSTADITWGNMWGVGRERSVVGTGLVGPESDARNQDVRMTASGGDEAVIIGEREGKRILGLVFEVTNLSALMSLLSTSPSLQIALPLYQIFARLISQPSHRRVLAAWKPVSSDDPTSSRLDLRPAPTTYLLAHLTEVVTNPKANSKVLEAALDLLAALVKDEGSLAGDLCFYCQDDSDLKAWRSTTATTQDISRLYAAIQGSNVGRLVHLFETGQTPVQIAAAGCLTSIYKAEPRSAKFEMGHNIANRILGGLVNLMATRIPEERTKLCFILAALVTDDTTLQKIAASLDYPSLVLEILHSIEQDATDGRLSVDSIARGREAAYLALTALASNLESTRTLIADSTLPVLTYLRDAISDSSYGVRAAACQLVRVLSRTVSLVRTSLMDSGVASSVVCMFANLVPARVEEVAANRAAEEWIDGGDGWSDGEYVVEITALAALCNLIADYLPLKQLLLNTAALRTICFLSNHPSETLVMNALWALNNAMFKSSEADKRTVVEALEVRTLIKLASRRAPVAVNVRALGIIQNYLADATLAELSNAVDKLGEAPLFGIIQAGLRPGAPVDLRVAALGVLVNICYGNEKLRTAIVGHKWIILALVEAIDSPFDEVKVHGLKAIRNLITSTTKRPRLPILAPFRPYCIGPRVKRLAEASPSLDVSTVAISLNEILEKVKPGSEAVVEDPLDR